MDLLSRQHRLDNMNVRVLIYLFFILFMINGRNAEPKARPDEDGSKKSRQLADEDSVTICGYVDDEYETHINSYIKFTTNTFKQVDQETTGNYVFSPYSVWLSMAAVVEGSEDRKYLDEALGLPLDWCVRQRYEKTILNTEKSSDDVVIKRVRAFVIDDGLRLKKTWQDYVPEHLHLTLITAPIKSDPATAAFAIRQIINFQFQELRLGGNSVLLDSMDYAALWQTSFSQILKKQAYYNYGGQQIGWIDMMRTKIRVRAGYLDEYKAKVIELPVGKEGRYQMLFAQFAENGSREEVIGSFNGNITLNLREGLKESKVPIEIQIPRFSLSSELNVRNILEKIGVESVWTKSSVTRHISEEPALPSTYIQRTTVFFDIAGVNPAPEVSDATYYQSDGTVDTGLHPAFGKDFIANKPMIFALIESNTYTCLFAGSFVVPYV